MSNNALWNNTNHDMNLKQALQKKLTKKEILLLVRAFDSVGDIAIIEIPKELEKKEKTIAETLLNLFKNIKTVAKKLGGHKGKYRTQKLKILAGEKKKITEYKENNIRLKLDVEKCYFSPRLSNERLRIAKQIKKNEKILVMFSGIGVYPIVFAKNSPAKEIYGIELNSVAHKYALENMILNKTSDKVKLIKGDVQEKIKDIKIKFDRILMPLPKQAENFLESAFLVSKKGTIIHFYTFSQQDKFKDAEKTIIEKCKKRQKKCKVLNIIKCGQSAPRKYRICIDFKVL